MSIKIVYEPERAIFLGAATRVNDDTETTALNALSIIFQNLLETSLRIDEKLISLSWGEVQINQREIAILSVSADMWSLTDNIRRVGNLRRFIPVPDPDITDMIEQIKMIRDSFQHIDERVSQHFNVVGGSVYGDVKWRYRASETTQESLQFMTSSAHIVTEASKNKHMGQVEDEKFKNSLGVYNVQLVYAGRSGRHGPLNEIIVDIDAAVKLINQLILAMEYHYSQIVVDIGDNNIEGRTLPVVVAVRIKDNAFKKNKNIQQSGGSLF